MGRKTTDVTLLGATAAIPRAAGLVGLAVLAAPVEAAAEP